MTFYVTRFPSRVRGTSPGSIDLDRVHYSAPAFYFNTYRGPGHPVAIDHGVSLSAPSPFRFCGERASPDHLIDIDRETFHHSAAPPLSFSTGRGSSPGNPIDIDSNVNEYHRLPSIRNLINLDDSYGGEPGSSPQNPIVLEEGPQKDG